MQLVSQGPIIAGGGKGTEITSISAGLGNDNVRLVGMRDGTVWKTTTTGSTTLTNVTPAGAPAGVPVGKVMVDPNNTDPNAITAYIGYGGFGTTGAPITHLWKTTNLAGGAATWVAMSNGLPDIPYRCNCRRSPQRGGARSRNEHLSRNRHRRLPIDRRRGELGGFQSRQHLAGASGFRHRFSRTDRSWQSQPHPANRDAWPRHLGDPDRKCSDTYADTDTDTWWANAHADGYTGTDVNTGTDANTDTDADTCRLGRQRLYSSPGRHG